jgi:O-antigen/teichoic acid export membrane protein
MSTITAPPSRLTSNATVRAGLVLSGIIGLANLPFLFLDIDWGNDAPPFALLLLNAAIGMVSVVCIIVAWNSGNRTAIRINAAALIINALIVLPGLLVETSAFITVVSAATVVATLVAVVLTMRRERTPVRVID